MSATTKQKKLVPELRFSGFDGEWSSKKLEDIAEYKNGGAFENNLVVGGKYNLITLNSIDIKGNLKAEHKTVSYADWYLQKNDLVMVLSDVAHGNFLGLVDVIPVDNKYVLNQRMGLLRKVDTAINLRFLRLNINLKQQYFKLHGQGSSQQNLSKGDILKFKVVAPTSKEQQKIADFIGSVDAWLDNLRQQKTALQSYKQGMMQKLFSGQIRFKDEEGRNFPELEEKKLGQTSQIVGGGTPDTTISTYWGGTISWYTPTEIKTGNPSASLRTITTAGLNNSSAKVLPIGTILLTTRATIGDVAILEAEAATNQGFQSLIVNEHNHNYFLYFWLQHHKNELSKKANGSTFLEVSSKEIAKIAISLPTKQEQQKIADFLTALDQTITTKAEEITKVEEWKKGLMQKMFV